MRIEESLSVTFDESLPEFKSYSLVEDDRIDEPIVQDLNMSPLLQVNVNEGYPKSLKEARGIKQRRRDLYSDGIRNFMTASGRGQLKEDLESSTWQRRQNF
nr:hypothetical protein [Tanacetum cinerariifolium]